MRCAIRLSAGRVRAVVGRLASDPGRGTGCTVPVIARQAATAAGSQSSQGASGVPPANQSRAGGPGIVGLTGQPISSASASTGENKAGVEVVLTAQNAQQILQNPGAMLFQVGTLSEAVTKKLNRLRVAADGRLPLVRVFCQTLPQICEALQIKSEPTILLMARGQAVAVLEKDFSPQTVTHFIEHTAQLLNLKVDLAEGTTEQLMEAESIEWTSPVEADEIFAQIGSTNDLQLDIRIRVAAGRARCALRQGTNRKTEAQAIYSELDSNGHGRLPEVKQLAAMLRLDCRGSESPSLDDLSTAVEAAPTDVPAVEAYATALFWAGQETNAVNAGLALLRRKRTDDVRQLVLALVEALGPRHPQSAPLRKKFNSMLFV